MNIALASDHRGLELLEVVRASLEGLGHQATIVGECSGDPCDYPDQARLVCNAIASGEASRGVLICGTGIGMCITANKFGGIRAALALDELSAELSRSHNDSNVLCLSGDLVGHALGQRIARAWMETDFEGGRHERRLKKISDIDIRLDRVEGSAAQDA